MEEQESVKDADSLVRMQDRHKAESNSPDHHLAGRSGSDGWRVVRRQTRVSNSKADEQKEQAEA